MDKLNKLKNCNYKCYPLINYEQIINFKPTKIEQSLIDEYCFEIKSKFTIPGPKVIITHDYKGGYLDDACIAGSKSNENYRFFHWQLIDIFIYFSHYLITIPPITWISAAHLNGCEILGTFITEDKNGKEFLESILSDSIKLDKFTNSLAYLMNIFKFDGWLINIENQVNGDLMHKLIEFIRMLNDKCKKIKKYSKIIWYDAVTFDGQLKWQNELNDKNLSFFDNCDGIFLNYCWNVDNLIRSLNMANQKNRKNDVFVGVDVFGRNCLGGFNTRSAIDLIKKFKLSIAIFAPGWTHETIDSLSKFDENNYKFWDSLNLSIRHLPTIESLPIETYLCQGFGTKFNEYGQRKQINEWTNILMQQYQLNCGQIDCTDSFVGGSCLYLNKFDLYKPIIELHCEWTKSIKILIVYKCSIENKSSLKYPIIIGHSEENVIVGQTIKFNDLKENDNLTLYQKVNLFNQNLGNDWKIYLAKLSSNERQNEFLKEIYLHFDFNPNDEINIKLGYLGIF